MTFTQNVTIPGGTEGNYYWMVRTNDRGEIYEGQNISNNAGFSLAQTTLSLPELQVGQTVNGAFTTVGSPIYYKIKPAVGTDVLVTLNGGGTTGWAQIFLGCGGAPTTQSSCASSPQWNVPVTSVPIDNATGQWYYLMLSPMALPSSPASFTLNAQALNYSLGSPGWPAAATPGA